MEFAIDLFHKATDIIILMCVSCNKPFSPRSCVCNSGKESSLPNEPRKANLDAHGGHYESGLYIVSFFFLLISELSARSACVCILPLVDCILFDDYLHVMHDT